MSEIIVQTNNLSKTFKKYKAVDGVDLRISKGDIYGFLGPNGAGKTTTIRMLLGLMKPSEGDIQLFGQTFDQNKLECLRRMGSLVESPSYYEHLSGRDNLEALRILLQVPKSRIDEVLEIVRLTKDAGRPVKQYSLGMKQRLGIAASLLGNPELLVLDEPTNGLDPSGIQEMRELIKSMPSKYGITVMISSHLLSEMDQMATRVGIISKGKLIYQDSIEKLRNKAMPQIAIRVSHVAKAKGYLQSNGWKVSSDADHLFLEGTSDREVAEVVAFLAQKQIGVYRIEENRHTLEDIFLDLTKGGELDASSTAS
ncbi:ABC transporter ATP-binding protein [Halobacillus locisalis]|uniref:ABC transporter ATP-binding protein n=1 Tax=Halobacillus locisalis TaxID=220753 RepID=A0A838CTE2_9BACI|nr:ABC transporter ATP-binding protein [Halobacillus locisalis]MBA2175211.1 ABC transporter ATP-binding protein [Halobacillus locisalis]